MKTLLFFLWLLAIYPVVATTTVPHEPREEEDELNNNRHSEPNRAVSAELFSSLEELAHIVDITYCVGSTGVYRPFRCAGRCHEFEGFELVTTFHTGHFLADSCGFLVLSHAPYPKRIILAFRGTYSIANALMDLSVVPQKYVPYPDPSDPSNEGCKNCTVHLGFMTSWEIAKSKILNPLFETKARYPDYQLVVIGHSLGGAVATLAGLEFELRGWKPQVTTFGQPKVGNKQLAAYIDKRFRLAEHSTDRSASPKPRSAFRRITHINDPIPLLPLEEWGYSMHAGEIYISKEQLPIDVPDLQYCFGNADLNCSAGQGAEPVNQLRDLGRRRTQEILKQGEQGDFFQNQNQQSLIPPQFRLWEVLTSHRDYFVRLGICLPNGGEIIGGKPWED